MRDNRRHEVIPELPQYPYFSAKVIRRILAPARTNTCLPSSPFSASQAKYCFRQEGNISFVFKNVDSLEGLAKVGDGGCVALLKQFIPELAKVHTSLWRPGARVVDMKNLPRGTAIATFINGRYPGLKTGNHAAFYLATRGAGFYAMDQYVNRSKIGSRPIERGRETPSGQLIRSASDSAQAFYVIELR